MRPSRLPSLCGCGADDPVRLQIHLRLVPNTFPALPLREHHVQQHLVAHTPGIKLGHVLVEHLDRRVNLTVQVGLMAQNFVELVEALVFGERVILKELCLPAVEPAETPGGGGDLFDVVAFEEVGGARAGRRVRSGDLTVSVGVFSEAGKDDVPGKESVRGGVACADGFAVFCFAVFSFALCGVRCGGAWWRILSVGVCLNLFVYYYSVYGNGCQGEDPSRRASPPPSPVREGLRNLPWGKVILEEGRLRGVEGAGDAAPAPAQDVGIRRIMVVRTSLWPSSSWTVRIS